MTQFTWSNNTKDVIPPGAYTLAFTGVALAKEPHAEYGQGIVWAFKVVKPDAHSGKTIERVTGQKPSPKNGCGKMLVGVLGRTPTEGENIDVAACVGKHYVGIVVQVEKTTKLESIVPATA